MTAVRESRDATVLRWLETAANGPVLALCAGTADGEARGRLALRVDDCLAEVAPYRLIDFALAAGYPLLVGEGCTPACRAREVLAPVAALVGPTVLALEGPAGGVAGPLIDVARPPVTRRELLTLLVPAAAPIHEATDDDGRLVESLRRAGLPGGSQQSRAARLAVEGCTACGVCVRTCPHDALTLTPFGPKALLQHAPDRCQGDGACVAACPAEAIVDLGRLTWDEALAGGRRLADVVTRICERCGSRTTAEDALCELCSFRRQNPFGFAVPPRFRQHGGISQMGQKG